MLEWFNIEDDPNSGLLDEWGTGSEGDYSRYFEDDPNSGLLDEWGTGSEGDYSPGLGNRWIDRNTDSKDLLDLVANAGNDAVEYAGGLVRRGVTGATGLSPALILGVVATAAYFVLKGK
jgi:hypothetical protein